MAVPCIYACLRLSFSSTPFGSLSPHQSQKRLYQGASAGTVTSLTTAKRRFFVAAVKSRVGII